jgi:HD-GYP domain-containing protein (c-di-GMP phosphodiesterase class II)
MAGDEYRYKAIPIQDLRVGMYVHDVGRRWLSHPWLRKSRLITKPWEVKELADFGITEVVVDLRKGVVKKKPDPEAEPPPKERKPRPEPVQLEEIERRTGPRAEETEDQTPMDEELPRVRQAFQRSAGAVRFFLDQLARKKRSQVEAMGRVVDDIVASICRNRDAFLTLAKVRVWEKYTFAHPLLTSVISVSFGRYLGMSREQLKELGLATILQDVGKTMIPERILEKPGLLTPEEFDLAKKHSAVGAMMIKDLEGVPRLALHLALRHHERVDGSGYPQGLSGDKVSPFMVIAGLADTFDALSTDRCYRQGLTPHMALRAIFQMRGRQFPEEWVDRFVQCLGIYPTGSVVRLATGEIGVVTGINHAQLLRPRVRIVTDSQGRPALKTRHVDLNTAAQEHRRITAVLDGRDINIDPAPFVDPDGVDWGGR